MQVISQTAGRKPWSLQFSKKNDRQDKTNYRPISLLTCMSKVFERIVFNHLYNFLVTNELLNNHNSGFRKNDSTINRLIALLHSIHIGLDEKGGRYTRTPRHLKGIRQSMASWIAIQTKTVRYQSKFIRLVWELPHKPTTKSCSWRKKLISFIHSGRGSTRVNPRTTIISNLYKRHGRRHYFRMPSIRRRHDTNAQIQ